MFKRILMFFAINLLVVLSISFFLSLFHVRPYLTAYGINYTSLLIFCLVWGMGGAFISLSLSRIMAKWLMGVRIIDTKTATPNAKHLLDMVERLSKQAGLSHIPQVGIYTSCEVNAFATGPTQKRSLVAVSSGLLEHMNEAQLEGVLAHEITHIANGDMVTMTLLQGVVNAFVMFLARILAFAFSGLGKSKEGSSGSYLSYGILVFVFEILFMILGLLVIAGFSRWREYRADAGGALWAGKEKMVAALEQLRHCQRMRDPKHQIASFEAMKISASQGSWIQLFATHPSLDKRIGRLLTR